MTHNKPDWMIRLEAKHGLPFDLIRGTVYITCNTPERVLVSVSDDYDVVVNPLMQCYQTAGPIRHYVGWTQQTNPINRVRSHYPRGTVIGGPAVQWRMLAGTPTDEARLKLTSDCPFCGGSFRESLRWTTATKVATK